VIKTDLLHPSNQNDCSNAAGKFEKCLHFLSIYSPVIILLLYYQVIIRLSYADHLIHIVQHHKKTVPKPTFTGTRNKYTFCFRDLSPCNNFCPGAVSLSFVAPRLQKHSHRNSSQQQFYQRFIFSSRKFFFETNTFDLRVVLLSCLVWELQKPPWHRETNSGQLLAVLIFIKYLSGLK
jgi:hypothetical protein